MVRVTTILFATATPLTLGATLKVTVKDADTGGAIPNSSVWWANGTYQYDINNLFMGNYEFNGSSADGTVIYPDANTSLYHFLRVSGGDNHSTSGRDYVQFTTKNGIRFLKLSGFTRFDADNTPSFNISYLNHTYIEMDVPLKAASNLSVHTGTPLPAQNGMMATKLQYNIYSEGYGQYRSYSSYNLDQEIPALNGTWSVLDTDGDNPLVPQYANLTAIAGGDTNTTLLLMLQLNGTVQSPNDYRYQVWINTSLGTSPDFVAEYNGTTGESWLIPSGGAPLESNVASISGSNISFILDRQYFAGSEGTFNVSAFVQNITDASYNDTIPWTQYHFNTTYSPQRSYNIPVMTTTELIALRNNTGWVNYSRLSDLTEMPLVQGNITTVTPALERGYLVTFNSSTQLPSDIMIEVRDNSTNDHAPFNDSLIAFVTGYGQSFYEDLYLPNGTYDFVFKKWGNISSYNRSITINGANVTVGVPPMPSSDNAFLMMNDVVRAGENLTASFQLPNGFVADEYRYYIYDFSEDTTVALSLESSGTIPGSGSISIPSDGISLGEHALIIDAINKTNSQFIRSGMNFMLTDSRLDIIMDMTTPPGDTVTVRVKPTSMTGEAIPNMRIDLVGIYPGDNQWWTVIKASNTTGSDGVTTITFTAPGQSGNYFLKFTGTSANHTARDYRPLMVQDFKLQAYADSEKYRLNDTVRIGIQASYFNGTPIAGANITAEVHWDPMGDWMKVNSSIPPVKTDSNGKAMLNYTINNTGPCIISLSASKDNMRSFAEVFAFVPLFDIEVKTDRKEYHTGETVNITINVRDQSGSTVSDLTFFHNESATYTDPFDAAIAASEAGMNGTVVVVDPSEDTVRTVNITGTSPYSGSYSTSGLTPGFYEIIVTLIDPTTGDQSAFEITEFELMGNLEVRFTSEKDIFEPYRLNDTVNLSMRITHLNGTQVSNGTLNYSVGMPWELFMPEDERERLGIGGPRIVMTGIPITNGTAWINFTLDSANFTGNTSIPMRDMKMVGTPPFLIDISVNGDGEWGREEIPIFITDLRVSIMTEKYVYGTNEIVQFTINVTNSTGPCDVTLQTDMGKPDRMIVFGPIDEYEIPVASQSTGNYTASYSTSNGVSGEYFGLVIASDGSTVAGGGVPFFVKSFDVTIDASNTTSAGSAITTKIDASGVTTPATVKAFLLSPSHKILDFKETTASTMPASLSLNVPDTAQPGIYGIKAIVEGSDGNIGAGGRGIQVINPNIQAHILIQNATENATVFSLNDTVNITVYFTGINTTTLKVFNETGETMLSETITQSGTSVQYTPTTTGVYYVRLDTSSTIAIAAEAFVVM